MGNLFSSNKSKAKAAPKEKTATEQLEAETKVDAKVDAPEATVPIASEEKQETPADEQQLENKDEETGKASDTIPEEIAAEVKQEEKVEATTVSVSEAVDAEKKSTPEQDDASEDDDSPPETLPEADMRLSSELLSEVENFEKNELKHQEVVEKNVLPNAEGKN